MNTANLQLEGLYVALSALMTALRQSGAVSEADLDAALADAEDSVTADRGRADLNPAHLDAIAFPIRYLCLPNKLGAEGSYPGFAELTERVGREKPQQAEVQSLQRRDIVASKDADVQRLEEIDRSAGRP
ncbi:hypothetical protein ACP4J4_02035 [Aureimonas ureilytica]|uniref:hypothetical protein n=1 Tax=Aureimonas ureilytica TaxID=401562 RepID=UPI003CFB7EF1